MDMGTHDYAEAQRALARQATVPTLDELKATTDMVTGPDGTLLPAKLAARGDAGWDGDQDRDSGQAARLAELVKDLDTMCDEVMSRSVMSGEVAYETRRLAETWQAIRKITKGNQP